MGIGEKFGVAQKEHLFYTIENVPMEQRTFMKIYIYALCDPESGAIRYVGQTRNLKKRLSGHLTCTTENQRKNQWIAQLLCRWQEPEMVVLSECTEMDADNKEAEWIIRLRASGVDLLNTRIIKLTSSLEERLDENWLIGALYGMQKIDKES